MSELKKSVGYSSLRPGAKSDLGGGVLAAALAMLCVSACASEATTDSGGLSLQDMALQSGRITPDDIEALAAPESPALGHDEARAIIDARLRSDASARAAIPHPYEVIQAMQGVTVSSEPAAGSGTTHSLTAARRRVGAKQFGGDIAATHAMLAFGANGRRATQCDFPVDDLQSVPGGYFTHFAGCSLWASAWGVFEVHGVIRRKYGALGWEAGFGFPVTDERVEADGVGRSNLFSQGNGIYSHPAAGVHEVHGFIHAEYVAAGATQGVLGYPTSDELSVAGSDGRMSLFQNGVMYWLPETGAHFVKGAILTKYRALGATGSQLGFPTSNEQSLGNGTYQSTFQGGTITWKNNQASVRYDQGKICTNGRCSTRPCKRMGEACCLAGRNDGCESFAVCRDNGELKVCGPMDGAPSPTPISTCTGSRASSSAQYFVLGLEDDNGCGLEARSFFANSLNDAIGCAHSAAPGATVVTSGELREYDYALRSPFGVCNDAHVPAFSPGSASECAQAMCTNCSVTQGSCW